MPYSGKHVATKSPAAGAVDELITDEPPSEAETEAIPAQWRQLAGVDACLASIRDGGDLPRLNFDSMLIPRLDPKATLMPIASLDELIDAHPPLSRPAMMPMRSSCLWTA